MTAQFSTVNQSRPEEITMKEDLTTISFVGDDNFGMSTTNETKYILGHYKCSYKSVL